MQRGKTRCKHVDRFQSSPGIGKECIFPNRPAHEYLWWSRLSPANTPTGTISPCGPNTDDGTIQFWHEFCQSNRWVALWGYHQRRQVLDFKKNLKIRMSSVGKMYLVWALLNNAITCLYRKTSEFFGIDPPSLQYYFRWILSSKQSRSGGHFN